MMSPYRAKTESGKLSALLICGMILAPLFVAIVMIQAFTRVGFDMRRTPISLLSLGDLGWIQIANFIITGLLALAYAMGLREPWLAAKVEFGDRC